MEFGVHGLRADLEQILLNLSLSPEIDHGNIAVAAKKILLACSEGLAISRASMWRVKEDCIECTVLLDDGELTYNPGVELKRVDFPRYFKAINTGRVLIAPNAETDDATSEFKDCYLKPLDIKSMLDMPVRFKGKMYGIICCESKGKVKNWQADEVVFLSSIAEICGRAISANFRMEYEIVLKAINENLEEVVAERTMELQQIVKDLKETQSQLVESEKMAAMGNLVSGVAHEVNTPLGVAITSISALGDSINAVEQALENKTLTQLMLADCISESKSAVGLALNNLDTAANLIHDFKLVAADQTQVSLTTINLREYLYHVLNTLKAQLTINEISLEFSPQADIKLTTYPGLIAQAVTNIVQNCIQHAFVGVNRLDKKLHIGLVEKEHSCILSIKDNGLGMSSEQKKHVFEPFYTTKRGSGHKGLGLAIAYNTVKQQLSGKLTLKSTVGQGTEFSIELPTE